MLTVAQGEIEELKDSLKYAEYMLTMAQKEKEALEKDLASQGGSERQFSNQLREKDHAISDLTTKVRNAEKNFT